MWKSEDIGWYMGTDLNYTCSTMPLSFQSHNFSPSVHCLIKFAIFFGEHSSKKNFFESGQEELSIGMFYNCFDVVLYAYVKESFLGLFQTSCYCRAKLARL